MNGLSLMIKQGESKVGGNRGRSQIAGVEVHSMVKLMVLLLILAFLLPMFSDMPVYVRTSDDKTQSALVNRDTQYSQETMRTLKPSLGIGDGFRNGLHVIGTSTQLVKDAVERLFSLIFLLFFVQAGFGYYLGFLFPLLVIFVAIIRLLKLVVVVKTVSEDKHNKLLR